MGLNSYIRSRVRLQRLSDAKLFSGWIRTVHGMQVSVDCAESGACKPNETYFIQAHGHELCASFTAKLTLVTRGSLLFQIEPPIRYLPATEDPRVRVESQVVTLFVGEEEYEMEVADASLKGLGLVGSSELSKGTVVIAAISTRNGDVKARGQVRYCRSDPTNPAQYRIGVLLEHQDRLGQARWQRVLADLAA